MVALLVLLLILAVFRALGFVARVLWFLLVVALVIWLVDSCVGGDRGRSSRLVRLVAPGAGYS